VSDVEQCGFVAVLATTEGPKDYALLVTGASAVQRQITVAYDFYEAARPAWCAAVRSLRVSPGRAVHVNHTTLVRQTNYVLPSMPDMVARQDFWGQELPLQYSGVVPIKKGFTDGVRRISITGTQLALATSVAYADAVAAAVPDDHIRSVFSNDFH
jgi:hypothetical protein